MYNTLYSHRDRERTLTLYHSSTREAREKMVRLESPDGPIWVAKRIKGMAFSDLKTQKKSGEAGAVSWRWTLARAGRSLARERLLVKRLPGGARHNGYLDTLDRPAARPPNGYLDTLDRWNETYLPTQIPKSRSQRKKTTNAIEKEKNQGEQRAKCATGPLN